MIRARHENAATVLVDPGALDELEVHLMTLDLRLWPIATAPVARTARGPPSRCAAGW